ncbi:MAG: amino acid adenylation domain-containing protein, partial [bacterium]|nr:amino acid adenylation domain-containing protein [bacterium]
QLYIKNFIIAGEVLPQKLVEDFFKCFNGNVPEITNAYGPTECCGDSTTFRVSKENIANLATLPIGIPMLNEQVYILDKSNRLVPVGVEGELCIGGEGVGRGYLNRPELSVEIYLPDPFGEDFKGRMYRTGDLARWLPDGNIDFIGRRDNQVQVMGVRIEPGEVETAILEHPRIKDAAVVAKSSGSTGQDKYLCAYV